MSRKTFIKTKDKETADKLITLGFQLVSYNSDVWVFINKPVQIFEQVDITKCCYSNILSI